MPNQPRQCLTCSHPLKGRSDKKFCDDHCRSAYNNQQRTPRSRTIDNINFALAKNRRILANLTENNVQTISTIELERLGFHAQYFTGQYIHQNRLCYRHYEYGLCAISAGLREIIPPVQKMQD